MSPILLTVKPWLTLKSQERAIMADQTHAINEAEQTIQSRQSSRASMTIEHRRVEALEAIADELTRVFAEVRTLRYLFATYAARAAGRQ